MNTDDAAGDSPPRAEGGTRHVRARNPRPDPPSRGFAIDLGSAIIAHLAVGDGPEAWGWAAATGVLWGLSYGLWRRLEARTDARRLTMG
jgi:hypothetical protein